MTLLRSGGEGAGRPGLHAADGRGKSHDSFGPVAACLVTRHRGLDPQVLEVRS